MNADYSNIPYGDHERQVLDIYIAGTTEPGPVLIYLHGGGYIWRDKSDILLGPLLPVCLNAGISVVAANYRFVTTDPFPAPMQDGTRVIQWVRHHADRYRWDPDKIAVSGTSAGAHIALWNAMKGDLSDPASDDPVARCSSRVSAVLCGNGQVTKDQRFYEKYDMAGRMQPNLLAFYGIEREEDLELPEIRRLSYEASAINFVSEEAPPALMYYDHPLGPVPFPEETTSIDVMVHHPFHGYLLKHKMKKLGRKCVLRHADDPLHDGELLQFLVEAFA